MVEWYVIFCERCGVQERSQWRGRDQYWFQYIRRMTGKYAITIEALHC